MYVHLYECTGLRGDFMVAMVTHGRETRGRMILVPWKTNSQWCILLKGGI